MPETTVKEGFVKGSLTQVPFPKVLNFINLAGKSGILALSQGKRKVHIHFDRGELVYVTSSYFPDMSLGDYLVKEGKIEREVHEQALEDAREGNTKLGTYLVEKGHLSPHELYEALNSQVAKKLFKLFAWTEGEFFFREGEIIGEEHRILNISFPNLLYRGIRFYLPMGRPPAEFRGRKENVLVKRLAGRYRIEDLKLGPADVRIFNLMNGERTLRQIVTAGNMNKRSAYKVIYALYLLELVGFPEAYRSDKITTESKRRREPRQKGRGFEISVSNDLIAEAMASVDRIKQEVVADEAFAPAPGGYQPSEPGRPTAARRDAVSDFISKVDESLASREGTSSEDFLSSQEDSFDAGDDGSFDTDDSFGGNARRGPAADPFGVASDRDRGFGDVSLGGAESLEPGGDQLSIDDYGIESDEDVGGEAEDDDGLLMDAEDYSNPEDLVKQAGYLLDDGNWDQAKRFLNKAIELDNKNADAYALLGWAMFNAEPDPTAVAAAEKTIKKGLEIDPKRYLHFLYLGKIYAASKQYEFAELHFVKALELNVECSEAKEEIKRIHTR